MKIRSVKQAMYLMIAMVVFITTASQTSRASDHADVHRGAANIGDFYIFKRGDKLVMVMTVMADLPTNISRFHFPDNVAYRFMIDRNSSVNFSDAAALKQYGGTIVNPDKIKEDVVIEIKFTNHGASKLVSATGLSTGNSNDVTVFTGVRDEPFIRGGFDRRNIACIVVELPFANVVYADTHNRTILAWSTTDTTNANGQADLTSHPYRSQRETKLNGLHPSQHFKTLNIPPDVVIYNTRQPAKFPNGRELADDVVDAFLTPQQIITNHGSNPSENDVPFLTSFPYLAAAHEFKPGDYPGPPENKEAFNTSITGLSLEKEINMKGRNARLRYWIVGPGGNFGQHFHDKRPAMVYLLEGTLTETKQEAGNNVTKTIQANDIFLEPNGVNHWLVNPSDKMVKMIVFDIAGTPFINRVSPGNARTDALAPPVYAGHFKTEELATYDLGQQLPENEETKDYLMKAMRLTLLPGERTALVNRQSRPAIAYVVSGNVLEHRSDEELAVKRAGESSVAANGISHYWENSSSETVVILVVEFVKK